MKNGGGGVYKTQFVVIPREPTDVVEGSSEDKGENGEVLEVSCPVH